MMLDIGKVKKIGLFASGVLFGTAGVKVLGSKDAKKFYINCLAAGLRAKDCVMTTATNIQENAEDILAEAKEINEQRNKEEVFEDESQAEESFNEEEAATAEASLKTNRGLGRKTSRAFFYRERYTYEIFY